MGARCRTDRGTRDYVALVNLTPHGCCVYSREPLLKPGQCVTLQPESLQGLRARVQWSDGCLAGLRFDNPLYGPVFEHLARTFARGEQDPRQAPADGAAPVQCGEAERTELLRKIAARRTR